MANPELMALSSKSLGWSIEQYKAWTWTQACRLLLRDGTPRPAAAKGLSFAKHAKAACTATYLARAKIAA